MAEQILAGGHRSGIKLRQCRLQCKVQRVARFLIPEQRIVAQRLGVGDGGFQVETAVGIDGEPRILADFGEHGFDAPPVLGNVGAADFHFDHAVAAVEVTAHFIAQRLQILARIVITAGGIHENLGIGGDAVLFGEQLEQRLARNFGYGIPDCHVQRADGHGAFAVATGFFVLHHRAPGAMGIDVVTDGVEQGRGVGFQQPRGEPLADQAALAVTSVGVEAITDDGATVDFDVGDHGDQAGGHFAEIDIGVADRRCDQLGDFTDVGNANHVKTFSDGGRRAGARVALAMKRSRHRKIITLRLLQSTF